MEHHPRTTLKGSMSPAEACVPVLEMWLRVIALNGGYQAANRVRRRETEHSPRSTRRPSKMTRPLATHPTMMFPSSRPREIIVPSRWMTVPPGGPLAMEVNDFVFQKNLSRIQGLRFV